MSPTTPPDSESPPSRLRSLARPLGAFALGLLVPLGFAPFEAWWLLPPVVAAQAALWLDQPPRRAFAIGFGFGAGAFLAGTYWLYHSIVTIGRVPLPLALLLMLGLVAIMALYYGAVAWLVTRLARGSRGAWLALLPGVWVVLEWLRGFVLSGFPWLSLGYALPESPLAGALPLAGVYGGSLVLVLIATALLVAAFATRTVHRVAGVGAAAVVAAAAAVTTDIEYVQTRPGALSASIGQLGLDQRLKWSQAEFTNTLNWYAGFVAAERGADVLVMPEAALPVVADRVQSYLDRLGLAARAGGSALVLGILRRDEAGVHNAMLALDGRERQWYDKRHLVPFGEFFPVPAFVREWMRLRDLPYSDIARGRPSPDPLIVAGLPVAVSICYEDAYPAEQLGFFPEAAFIINVSNDAWFGDSIAPHQHMQIARTRSAESQRWQLRATNSGITAIIDGRGHVVDTAPSFEPAVLRGSITSVRGHTPYTRTGNLPVMLLCMLAIVAAALLARRR